MGGNRIADAVHGTILLDEAESAVISTRAFQRLRGVKHLGLASLAFPGADYSRFSHGVGTMHVTKLVLSNLEANVPGSLTTDERRLYSMAALLHDIGHYPFSHTFERALKNWNAGTNILRLASEEEEKEESAAVEDDSGRIWLHEAMGRHVILEDPELADLLASYDIDSVELCNIIERTHPPKFSNLVSSDLDADRTDYLMRTAKHTGLPYGNVDLPYLLSQIRVDNEQRICFTSKGMRAAEHLLLCRYFDYQQVSYHKTVAALELVLNDAVGVLLDKHRLQCSKADLRNKIQDGSWYGFDDAHITAQMRAALADSAMTEGDKLKFQSILNRWPAKLVAERERLGTSSSDEETFKALEKLAVTKKEAWESQFECQFYVWTQPGTSLTKIGSTVPVSSLEGQHDDDYDKLQQAVRIQMDDGGSRVIQECKRSLISVLASSGLYSIRVYALLSPQDEHKRSEISARVNDDLGPLWIEP